MKHLYLATPLYDLSVSLGYCQSLMQTVVACTKAGIGLSTDYKPGCYIHGNRNWLARRFMESGADTLLFVDADVTWDAESVPRLYDYRYDVCGGAYPLKQDNEAYPVKLLDVIEISNGCVQAQYLPGGFLMIRRHVLETMARHCESYADRVTGEKTTAFFQNVIYPGQTGETGEDVEFCNRWRKLGGDIWCDPNIDFEHQGAYRWSGNLSSHLHPKQEQAA